MTIVMYYVNPGHTSSADHALDKRINTPSNHEAVKRAVAPANQQFTLKM